MESPLKSSIQSAQDIAASWLNKAELRAKYRNTQSLEKLKTLFSVREFFVTALKPSDFAVPEEFTCVVPTAAGQAIMQQLEQLETPKPQQRGALFVFFLLFPHQDLLKGFKKTEPSGLIRALGRL